MKNILQKYTLRNEFWILISLLIISFIFWQSILLFPLKFLTIIFHEIGHAAAAIVTGGKIISISITNDLGGLTKTDGGSELIIAFAGYFSSLIFGAVLFFTSYNKRTTMILTAVISAILLIYAANYIRSTEGIIFSLIFVLFFFGMPKIVNFKIYSSIQKFIGLISSFYVLFDLRSDIFSGGYYFSDAFFLYRATDIHEYIWGGIWILISVAVLFFEFKYLIKNAFTNAGGKDLSQS